MGMGYPIRSECEWIQPDPFDLQEAKYETLPKPPPLLSQFANAAQENLITIAVDGAGTILDVNRYSKGTIAASQL